MTPDQFAQYIWQGGLSLIGIFVIFCFAKAMFYDD
jgi:hypothetical protein